MKSDEKRPTGAWAAFRSWRTGSVTLQSFFSGLPLGLVLIALPAWMARIGVDIRTIGLITLVQVPWTFKFLWSPVMDRWAPPLLGRKRGWAVVAQIGLLVSTLGLAAAAAHPETIWVIAALSLAIAFASATQDIAIDAYAVEVLHAEEQGSAVGARTALYRAGMMLAGAGAITFAGWYSGIATVGKAVIDPGVARASYNSAWGFVLVGLGLFYLVAILLMVFSPEPEQRVTPPRTLRAAVWEPFVGLLRQHRALEIAAFLFLYKLGDNLAGALIRPFLVQAGYGDFDVGIATGTVGLIGTLVGTFVGGILTTRVGLGHALWLFGAAQAFSNFGYAAIAGMGADRPLMFLAIGIETACSGLGTGAFGVLLLRLTEKRFSATQYALLSSVFAIGRTVAGPIAGFMVDAMGWQPFFIVTFFAAVPGLICLHRFVPLGTREVEIAYEPASPLPPASRAALLSRAVVGVVFGMVGGALVSALLSGLKSFRARPAEGFPLGAEFRAVWFPVGVSGWTTTIGVVVFGLVIGLTAAAMTAARRGGENEREARS